MSKNLSRRIAIVELQSARMLGSLMELHYDKSQKSVIKSSTIFETESDFPLLGAVSLTDGHPLESALRLLISSLSQAHIQTIGIREGDARKIDSVHFLLSSPWSVSQSLSIEHKFREKTKVTKEMLNELLSKLSPRQSHAHHGVNVAIPFDHCVTDIYLNGYVTDEWLGRYTRNITIREIVSSASDRTLNSIRNVCLELLPGIRVGLHSAIVMQYASMRYSKDTAKDSRILLHVHQRVTDVMGTDKHGNLFFGSFPFGYENIRERAVRALGMGEHTSNSVLNIYANDHGEGDHVRSHSKKIEAVLGQWAHGFMDMRRNGFILDDPSGHVLLCTDSLGLLLMRSLRSVSRSRNIELITAHRFTQILSDIM